jgi:hypothetical protein
VDVLKSAVYPFVRDNAEFYASWAEQSSGSTGPVTLPFTCGQEACACRDNTGWYWRWGERVTIPLPNMTEQTAKGIWDTSNGEHNAHADIAFASASFRKAAEYSDLLGVDADLRANWLALLARMPAYPTEVRATLCPSFALLPFTFISAVLQSVQVYKLCFGLLFRLLCIGAA